MYIYLYMYIYVNVYVEWGGGGGGGKDGAIAIGRRWCGGVSWWSLRRGGLILPGRKKKINVEYEI